MSSSKREEPEVRLKRAVVSRVCIPERQPGEGLDLVVNESFRKTILVAA